MLSDEAMYERMQNGWRGGRHDGTQCGLSSTLQNTKAIRDWLPEVVKRYSIRDVCDAGAGDLHWIKYVQWDVTYRAFDLISRHKSITQLDITTECLPTCDLVLCRAVLNHLDTDRIIMALDLFSKAGKYLLATQFNAVPAVASQFCRLDLRSWLGEPLEQHEDTCGAHAMLALWKL